MDNHSDESVGLAGQKEPLAQLQRLTSKERFMTPSKSWSLCRRNSWFSWQRESWAMLFSIACLIAVAAIMAWIDGKRLSIWRWAIQPNAVISVLIVSSKAALMISTASCVSQLKWTHFQRNPRQLHDLEDFDDASRGAWGSLCLLSKRSGYLNIAVTLGCSITILVLAMETFGQQLLSFPERMVSMDNSTASFPVIQNLTRIEAPSLGHGYRANDRLLKSRLSLMQSIYGSNAEAPFNCPASSCTWDSQVTLGVCSRCRDISSIK